jgi:hypothetical protein
VAFHPPVGKPGDATAADVDENTWILAVVTKCYTQDKNRLAFDMLSTVLKCTHCYLVMKFRMQSLKKTGSLDSKPTLSLSSSLPTVLQILHDHDTKYHSSA